MQKQGHPALQPFKEKNKKFPFFKTQYRKLKQIILKLQWTLEVVHKI